MSALSLKKVEHLSLWFDAGRGLREKTLLADVRLAAGGWLLADLARAVCDRGGLAGEQADLLWVGLIRMAKVMGQLDLFDELS